MSTLRNIEDSGELSFVSMGLGWDPVDLSQWVGGRADIDLNAAACMFAGDSVADVVYHEQLSSADGAVRLLGDSTTGEGDGDNEVITVDLTRLAPELTAIFFIVTSYSGQSFGQVRNAFCRLVDNMRDVEFARYSLDARRATGFVAGQLVRTPSGWQYQEITAGIEANHPVEAVPQLSQFLATGR